MKMRFTSLLLAVLLLFCLTACGGSSAPAETESDTEKAAVGETEYTEEDDYVEDDSYIDDTAKEAGEEAEEAVEEAAEDAAEADPYAAMKAVYTKAGAGQGADGIYYFLAYDENVDNAIFVMLEGSGEKSMNIVGPVTQNDNLLTITDTKDESISLTFGLSDISEQGFTMVLKNGEEIPMGFTDAGKVIDIITAIDNGTEIINPLQ